MEYYNLPLRPDLILKKRQHPVCELSESIRQHIKIILTTAFRESRFDEAYGCSIWEQDFENIAGIKWKDEVCKSIEESIMHYEKRLAKLKVRVEIDELETEGIHNRRIKKRLKVVLEGNIMKTDEKFTHNEQIFISPLSLD